MLQHTIDQFDRGQSSSEVVEYSSLCTTMEYKILHELRDSACHELKIMELHVECAEPAAPPMFQMMDNDRNSWQYRQAGSYLTDTGGDGDVLLSSTSLPNFDWQPSSEGESWQLPVDPDVSLLHSDLEDHQRLIAFGSGPFESIENGILSTNGEFRSQFRGADLNGNSHASSESWKTFLVLGDGDVGTVPGPENLGRCSRATQGPFPKSIHTVTAARIAQNLRPQRNQKKIDGVKKTVSRRRGSNWTLEENRLFLQHMEVEVQKAAKPPWKAISGALEDMNFVRGAKACEDHWGVLLADLKKFGKHFGSDCNILRDLHLWPSVGTMSREQRSQIGLPPVFEVEWFEAIARIVEERSKHRKSRRECRKGRIVQVAGTPASSSSCPQQFRVCAASATPSSEVFDTPERNGDGISVFMRFLTSSDRNMTVEQTLEVMRISLEEKKTDLRRREIEWERERMYQGQRSGIPENTPGRPPDADEWNQNFRGRR